MTASLSSAIQNQNPLILLSLVISCKPTVTLSGKELVYIIHWHDLLSDNVVRLTQLSIHYIKNIVTIVFLIGFDIQQRFVYFIWKTDNIFYW